MYILKFTCKPFWKYQFLFIRSQIFFVSLFSVTIFAFFASGQRQNNLILPIIAIINKKKEIVDISKLLS